MSTNPTITEVPAAPVTVVPAQVNDFSKPIDQLRQEAFPTADPVAPPAAPVVEAPAVPAVEVPQDFQLVTTDQGVEIRLASGEIFKGKSEAEAWPKVAAAKVQSERFIKELKRQNTPAAPATPAAPTLSDADVDMQYWAIAGSQGKAAADRYYAQQRPQEVLNTFAAALGLNSGEELTSMLGNMRQTTEQVTGNMVAAQFHSANPDFPATPEASEALVTYAVNAGLNPQDPRHLSIAHAACLREKVYAPAATKPTAQAQPVIPPMVTPTGNSPTTKASDADLWKMPLGDLRKQTFGR